MGMVLLQHNRWKFSQKDFVAKFILFKLNFIHKNDKFTF